MTPRDIDHHLDKVLSAPTREDQRTAMSEAMAAGGRDAEYVLRTAHTVLAFAIRRLRNNSSARDTELCASFSKARAEIEKAVLSFGGSLAERRQNENGNLGKGLPNDPDNVPEKENIGPSGADVRATVEWLANHIGGISLMDWQPCANVLLQAADRLDALAPVQAVTPEMVNAAWNKGKDLRMTGLPTDFRQVLEAALQAHQPGWLPVDTAPEDQHVILMTTGGHVGEAIMLRDEDTGQQKWTWALGPVHPNHTPLGWQPMPLPPPPAEGE